MTSADFAGGGTDFRRVAGEKIQGDRLAEEQT